MTDNLNSLKRHIAGCNQHELANWSSLSNLQNIQVPFSSVPPDFQSQNEKKKLFSQAGAFLHHFF